MTRKNIESAHRLITEGFGNGNLGVVDEIMAPDSVGHAPPDEIRGPEGVKGMISTFHEAFPDIEFAVADTIAEGDEIVLRWIARGTHEGPFQGIPPTGNRIEMTGISIERYADGKIVEGWTNRDALGMLVQLGVLEPPAQSPEPER